MLAPDVNILNSQSFKEFFFNLEHTSGKLLNKCFVPTFKEIIACKQNRQLKIVCDAYRMSITEWLVIRGMTT